jgi:hypothetical protein
MNEKSNQYALAALKNKRAELSSGIIELKRQLRHKQELIVHVDATLRLLDPSIEPDAIPSKRFIRRVKLFKHGELGRLIIDALRRADGGPLSTFDITSSVMAVGGHDETARRALGPRVRGNLSYLNREGKVLKIGNMKETKWRLH